jgi:hypothetical protein
MLLTIALFGPVLLGLGLFIFAIGSIFVESYSLINSRVAPINFNIAGLAVHITSTIARFLRAMWQISYPETSGCIIPTFMDLD